MGRNGGKGNDFYIFKTTPQLYICRRTSNQTGLSAIIRVLVTIKNSSLNAVFPITLRWHAISQFGSGKIVIRISFTINFSHLIVDVNTIWYAACYTQ